MSGWLALNASTTCFSTSTCSGASPPPRQQYQRISVWPGAAVEPSIGTGVMPSDAPGAAPSWDGASEAPADPPGTAVGLDDEHAATTIARTAATVSHRLLRI